MTKTTNCNQVATSFDDLREHVRLLGVTEISRAVRFIGACLLVILIFSCGPLHASITLSADDDRIESITDLSIDGVVYDATFHHQISPNDLLALYPNGELPFADNPTATLAAEAIRAAVAAAAITPSNGGLKTAYYYIGFGDFSSGVMFAVLDQEVGLPGAYEFSNYQNPSSNGLPNAMPNNQALVSFAVQAVVAAPAAPPNDAGVCPDTLSQGGENTASASFILHDSIGGIGGVSQTSASFQSESGYIPQTLSGCNCMTCDDFIAEACVQLQLTRQTTLAQAVTLLEGWIAGNDLFSVDICADGLDGAGSSEACSAFILQSLQAPAGD